MHVDNLYVDSVYVDNVYVDNVYVDNEYVDNAHIDNVSGDDFYFRNCVLRRNDSRKNKRLFKTFQSITSISRLSMKF